MQFYIKTNINTKYPTKYPSQQLIQAPIIAMALSAEVIVAIFNVFVALPSALIVIWALVKRANHARLRRRGMAVFLRRLEEELLSN